MYFTYKRTCRDWKSFARARKVVDLRNLTYEAAARRCDNLNAALTPAQIKRGTRFEFEKQ